MDESYKGAESVPNYKSIWHIAKDELMQLPQNERDRILNERTNRLYDAVSHPNPTQENIDRILNKEQYTDEPDA